MTFGRRARHRAMLLAASFCAGCLVFCAIQTASPAPEEYRSSGVPPAAVGPVTQPSGEGRLNINTADSAALQGLNGIGPALADAIVSDREQNGPFRYPEELMTIRGIGSKTVEKLRDLICFE